MKETPTMTVPHNPLKGPPPADVPLSIPSLVHVVAQVRFPIITSIEAPGFIAPFQEAVRADYPVLRLEKSPAMVIGPGGVRDMTSTSAWRFYDLESRARVTLARDFVALDTARYAGRDDFIARFSRILVALNEHVRPAAIDRLGLRYVNRVVGANLDDIAVLVRPEVSGILSTPLRFYARHALTEQLFDLPDEASSVLTRWGRLPADTTVDPALIEPVSEPSWLLDIDAFDATVRSFDAQATAAQARLFAARIYSIFRWAVSEEFLRRHGGNI